MEQTKKEEDVTSRNPAEGRSTGNPQASGERTSTHPRMPRCCPPDYSQSRWEPKDDSQEVCLQEKDDYLAMFRHIERGFILLLECSEVHRKLKVTIINSRENKEL